MISADTMGSSIYSISDGSGRLDGLVKLHHLSVRLVDTVYNARAVVTKSRLYSRSRRSSIISRCRRPKETSGNQNRAQWKSPGSKNREASFNCNFSSASLDPGILRRRPDRDRSKTIGVTFYIREGVLCRDSAHR